MTNFEKELEQILNWLSPGSAVHRKDKALKTILSLHQAEVIDARIDEIKSFQKVLIGGRQPIIASIFDSRIADLKQLKEDK